MIYSCHQLHFWGWLGYLHKIAQSDVHVVFDTAQYEQHNYQNRVQIKTDKGAEWLTVPVHSHLKPIREIQIVDGKWQTKHWKTLRQHYQATPYWSRYAEVIHWIYQQPVETLDTLDWLTLEVLMNVLGIETELVRASELTDAGEQTERLVHFGLQLNADTYLSGTGASQDYLDVEKFQEIGMDVQWQDFQHPEYPQRYDGCIAGLSALDALLNVGAAQTREWLCST